MDQPADKKRRAIIAVVLVFAFVGYPLSVGPAAMLAELSGSEAIGRAFEIAYAPMLSLPKPLDGLIADWINWWL